MIHLQTLLLVSSSDIGHSIVELLSKYIKGQYEVIVYNLTDTRNYIWLGIAITFKLIQIIIRSSQKTNK